MVLAAQALAKDAEGLALSVDGAAHKGALYRTMTATALEARPVIITNSGASPARAVITVSGIPTTPEPALNAGFALERTVYTLKGVKIEGAALKQNERYVVVLKTSETSANRPAVF